MGKTAAFLFFLLFLLVSGKAFTLTVSGIETPPGYSRVTQEIGSFSAWLPRLPLARDARIMMYGGGYVPDTRFHVLAVIDLPLLFSYDLEQCADWCMRFWAEYHRQIGALDRLYLFSYEGSRVYLKGFDGGFEKFLKRAMDGSNTYSLRMGCGAIREADLRPGDMIVQNDTGGIGHVSMIMDECADARGERLYLVGFSFMPAQQFHVEEALPAYGESGWFRFKDYIRFLSEFYNYGVPVLRRF
jgi:hypothetical protein